MAASLDEIVEFWLCPRVYHYVRLPKGGARSAYSNLVVAELLEEFDDLHPDYLKFKSIEAEVVYLNALKHIIHRRAHTMTTNLKKSGYRVLEKDLDSAGWKHFQKIYQPRKKRAHDLWAVESEQAQQLIDAYPAYLKQTGASPTVATLELYRKGRFNAMGSSVQTTWEKLAEQRHKNPELPSREEIASVMLPVLNEMLSFYSQHSGNPVLFASACLSRTTPGTVETFGSVSPSFPRVDELLTD